MWNFGVAKKNANFPRCKLSTSGHVLSKNDISIGQKKDAVINMPTPKTVSELRSYLGAVQFMLNFYFHLFQLYRHLFIIFWTKIQL